ncbi:MAG: ABC transporter permease [Clostridia bacterium]|jgi:putative ABC transport system permease protein|nr:ABC transporter permease [Clostridia bacterium]
MDLLTIALSNLKIRKVKMLFIVLGMIIGTATIVTLFTITTSMEKELQERFDQLGTRVLITPEQKTFSLSYRGITTAGNISGEKQLFSVEELKRLEYLSWWNQVTVASPKLVAALTGENGNLLGLGVDFEQELKLKRYWEVSGSYPEIDNNQLVLGHDLARRLGKKTGDYLEVAGARFTVTGVMAEIGTEEDKLAYFNLADLQKLSGNNGLLSMAEISLGGTFPREVVEGYLGEIVDGIPGLTAAHIQDAAEGRRALVERFAKFALMVTAVVITIGSLIMGTTMMASVKERTAEIGVFRATGFRKSHIMKIIFMEAGILSGLAGVGGYLLGMLVATFTGPVIIELQTGIVWSPIIAVMAIGLTITIGLAASFYPAYRAANLDPVEALRFI